MSLSLRDTDRLTRVASFPNMEKAQRWEMLANVSNEARTIGRIIIDGARTSDTLEHRRVASKFSAPRRNALRNVGIDVLNKDKDKDKDIEVD